MAHNLPNLLRLELIGLVNYFLKFLNLKHNTILSFITKPGSPKGKGAIRIALQKHITLSRQQTLSSTINYQIHLSNS